MLVLADRRAHLERYRSRWERFDQAELSYVDILPHTQWVIDGEVLAFFQEFVGGKIDVTFMRLPSISRGIQRKRKPWVVQGLPRSGSNLKMYPEVDMLVYDQHIHLWCRS